MRFVRGGGVVAVVAAVVALAGCTSGEEPPSVLTSTDLGPGQWRGPFAEAADADVAARDSRCTSLRPFFLTDEGGGVVAQELSAWAAGETLVTVQVDRHQAGDADLRERLSTPELLEDCVEAQNALAQEAMDRARYQVLATAAGYPGLLAQPIPSGVEWATGGVPKSWGAMDEAAQEDALLYLQDSTTGVGDLFSQAMFELLYGDEFDNFFNMGDG